MPPLISVIIPAFNCKRYISECVGSVLGQTYRNIEVIIVDDGSTDGTLEVLSSLNTDNRLKIIHQTNGGTGSARNSGLAMAQGEYLAFLDADDYWQYDKLELQLAYLASSPDCGAVFGLVSNFLDPSLAETAKLDPIASEVKIGIHPGCMLIRAEVLKRVGPFKEDQFAEFLDWWSRFELQGVPYYILHSVLMYRRIHAENKTLLNKLGLIKSYLKIVRQSKDNRKVQNVTTS